MLNQLFMQFGLFGLRNHLWLRSVFKLLMRDLMVLFYVSFALRHFFRLFMNDGHDEDDTDLGELFKHVNFAKLKECKTEKDMCNVLVRAGLQRLRSHF